MTPDRIVLRRPDDWHVHLRDGTMLRAVLPATAWRMGRALVMPNLFPAVSTTFAARAYRSRIQALLPPGTSFEPLMTVYLTDQTDPDDLEAGHQEGLVVAAKLYPAGATTNSAAGVTDLAHVRPALERMERIGMPLLVHGEVTRADVDIFDREAAFLDKVFGPMLAEHQGLRAVLEHVTTKDGIDFVRAHAPRVGATLTPQHLLVNRNDMLVGGIRPHFYCLPVLKRAVHQRALIEAATSGEAAFFLGTDSAPHPVSEKESACGCAGCFTAPVALELYAEVFDRAGALDRLEGFASLHGPAFYGLQPNEARVVLERRPFTVPASVKVGDDADVSITFGGWTLGWSVVDEG